MGKLIQFQHPGNYSLIVVDGQYYRLSKDQPIPKEATFLEDDIMNMPGLWAHPRYNEREKTRRTTKKNMADKRGHDNP